MGSFEGHVLPGTFFIIAAVWWGVQVNVRYWKNKSQGKKFTSSVTYPAPCTRSKDFPLEAALKLFFSIAGILVELLHHIPPKVGPLQHATMYFAFALSGVVDLLVLYKASVPKNIDHIALAMAFAIEGVLFNFHLAGTPPLDVMLHKLLVYAVAANTVVILIEMMYRNSLLAAMGRSYFCFLQGTWFYQVGYVLYNPFSDDRWDLNDHESLIMAALAISRHACVAFILMLVCGLVVSCCYKGNRHDRVKDETSMHRLLSSSTDNHVFISLDDEEGIDLEPELLIDQ